MVLCLEVGFINLLLSTIMVNKQKEKKKKRCRKYLNIFPQNAPTAAHHGVSLPADQRLDGSVLQSQRADCAALAIGHKQAAPGLLRGQSQARGLSKAGFVGVRVVAVLLAAAARPAHARPRLGLAAIDGRQ